MRIKMRVEQIIEPFNPDDSSSLLPFLDFFSQGYSKASAPKPMCLPVETSKREHATHWFRLVYCKTTNFGGYKIWRFSK